ncbi:MAG: hypothetical protein ACI4DY_15250 [Monoglobaceae bacterium]
MSDEYYYAKTESLPERESFNNTIILLTMVRSQYYYIVGFSRPNSMIEIAFDFESSLHRAITESITLHFGESEEYLIMRCRLKNVSAENSFENGTVFEGKGNIICSGSALEYEYLLPKDKLIPISVERMNQYILDAKTEIIGFLEKHYNDYRMSKR